MRDLPVSAELIRYRRERWLLPSGKTVLAALPAGIVGGFGPELRRFVLAKPGEGPDRAAREAGHYTLWFTGRTAGGETLRAIVKGDRDPGYGSTCKLIGEAALCLLQDVDRRATPGGVWTPGSALGLALVRRLQARAGLSFEIAA